MKTVKLRSLTGARGISVDYPIVGILEHDSNGVCECPEDKVEALLEVRGEHLQTIEQFKAEVAAKNTKADTTVNESIVDVTTTTTDAGGQPGEGGTDADMRTELEGMTKENLQSMADSFSFPKEEWNKLNKGPLVDYLLAKTKEGEE